MSTIEIKNVSKSYGKNKALDDVSLTLKENCIYGLLGRNGAGKSTLLNIVSNRIFADSGEVTVDGEPVQLTPKEYEILKFLMMNPGICFSPSEIYRKVWGDVPIGVDNAIAVHIRHIREKIEIDPASPRYLKVAWGRGYKFEKSVSE